MSNKIRINDFLLIIIGLMFFLNPMIALFDLIPDFIGCALIMFALHRLSSLTSDFEDSFNYFKYMIVASGARLLISMLSAMFLANSDDVSYLVTYLSISLVLAIIECAVAYFALTALCEGLDNIGYRYTKQKREPIELRNIGIAFFIVRGLCSMLPYVTSVLDKENEIITAGDMEQSMDYTILLTVINIIITVVFAVFFAITIIKHLRAYVKNREIRDAVSDEISNRKTTDPDFFTRKNLGFCLTLLAYCSLFLIDFLAALPVGGMNFIPDFVFGITVIWVVVLLRKQLSGYIAPLISGCIYTALSAASYFVYNDFLSRHFSTDFDLIMKKYFGQYILSVAFAFAESIALIVLAVLLIRYLMPLATRYSICDYTAEFARLGKKTEQERLANKRLLIGFGVFLCVIALSGTALCALFQIFDVGYDDIDFPYLLTHIALHIAFYAYSSTLFLRLRAGVNRRYEPTPERRD